MGAKLREMAAVFGRVDELAAGDALLTAAAEGCAVLVFEGEPGAGKTTVWGEVARRAAEQGFFVLSCQPSQAEAKFALSAVADLLEHVPADAFDALPDPQRRALEVVLFRVEASREAGQPRRVATAVRSILAELSRRQQVLVAVDDVQWLDSSSADVLEFVLRRSTAVRGGWLFARRHDEACRLQPELVVPRDLVAQSVIGPLTVGALHHVVKDRLGLALPRSALSRLHGISGGNPFYALEIARELARDSSTGEGSMPVPDSVRALLSRRLRRLPAATREALLAASALSNPTTALVDETALRPAEDDDLVSIRPDGHIAFRHPLYASAVYGSASLKRRREVHLGLAARVTDGEERARHLAAATSDPDEDVARALEEGAVVARARGAWGSAAELLERAASLTVPAESASAQARIIAAAEHRIRAGDRSRARELLEGLLDQSLDRSRQADALRLLGVVSYNDDNIGEAIRLFNLALECAEDAWTAIYVGFGLAYAYAQLFDFASALPHVRSARARAEAAPGHPLLAETMAWSVIFDWNTGRGVDWDTLERSLELEDPDTALPVAWHPSVIAGLLHAYVGNHDEGRKRLRTVWADAVDRGDESDVAFVALWLSWLEARAGDLASAATVAEEALTLAAATGGHVTGAWVLAHRGYVHALLGDVAAARRDCADAATLLEQFEHVLARLWIAAALGTLELSLGDPDGARRACEPLVTAVEQQGIGEPVPLFFLPDALEALVALGHLERAELLIDALEERGRALDRGWAIATAGRCRAVLLAARGDLDGALSTIDEALAEHARLDMPLELARTLLTGGVIQRRARQRRRATESFTKALELFERVGAQGWAARTRAELDRVGSRRGSGTNLTPVEQQVAELVARGLTNREVATALSVSPKTVEANLGRVYRKLEIASRAELGVRMAKFLQK